MVTNNGKARATLRRLGSSVPQQFKTNINSFYILVRAHIVNTDKKPCVQCTPSIFENVPITRTIPEPYKT
jgi:hypothetical protein